MKLIGLTLKMEAARSSETSVNVYQTTLCYISEDSIFHSCRARTKNPTSRIRVNVFSDMDRLF